MRISYSEDEDYPGQFDLWQANCTRSLRGRRGQEELKELRAALLAMTDRRLILGSLEDEEGGVCALGAYAKHKGLDLSKFDVDSDTDEVGIAGGMPRMVAWKVVCMNDHETDHLTPEKRWNTLLAWVESQLTPPEGSNP